MAAIHRPLDHPRGRLVQKAPPRRVLAAAVLAALLLTGCALVPYASTPVPDPPTAAAPTSAATSQAPCTSDASTLRSYEPSAAMPEPGRMPAGSTMAAIQKRGRLIAGVSADTKLLGSRDPFTGTIKGFDIDLVSSIAAAIFGDPDAYELRVITAAQRIPALREGTVDIVARNMTITCDRWRQIAFSTVYYRAGQKVLVRRGSTAATTITDLNRRGVRVCAPNSTSSMDNLLRRAPLATAVGADTHTGCLALFQNNVVDAITGDDTVLAGLAAQDPYAVIPDQQAFTSEPYGIGINAEQVDLVRFVNGRLEQLRENGDWTRIYNAWLREPLGDAPRPPTPAYGR